MTWLRSRIRILHCLQKRALEGFKVKMIRETINTMNQFRREMEKKYGV